MFYSSASTMVIKAAARMLFLGYVFAYRFLFSGIEIRSQIVFILPISGSQFTAVPINHFSLSYDLPPSCTSCGAIPSIVLAIHHFYNVLSHLRQQYIIFSSFANVSNIRFCKVALSLLSSSLFSGLCNMLSIYSREKCCD